MPKGNGLQTCLYELSIRAQTYTHYVGKLIEVRLRILPSVKATIATLAQARDFVLGLHHQYTDRACWEDAAAEFKAPLITAYDAMFKSFKR